MEIPSFNDIIISVLVTQLNYMIVVENGKLKPTFKEHSNRQLNHWSLQA